jgi:hypothetical protein
MDMMLKYQILQKLAKMRSPNKNKSKKDKMLEL